MHAQRWPRFQPKGTHRAPQWIGVSCPHPSHLNLCCRLRCRTEWFPRKSLQTTCLAQAQPGPSCLSCTLTSAPQPNILSILKVGSSRHPIIYTGKAFAGARQVPAHCLHSQVWKALAHPSLRCQPRLINFTVSLPECCGRRFEDRKLPFTCGIFLKMTLEAG